MLTVTRRFQSDLEREKEKLARLETELESIMSIYQPQKDQILLSDLHEKGTFQLM